MRVCACDRTGVGIWEGEERGERSNALHVVAKVVSEESRVEAVCPAPKEISDGGPTRMGGDLRKVRNRVLEEALKCFLRLCSVLQLKTTVRVSSTWKEPSDIPGHAAT